MKSVVIFGAGGHAHVIADIIRASGDEVVAFLDDDLTAPDSTGSIDDYKKYGDKEFVIGIGDSEIREKISELPLKWYTAIHPSTVISPSATIEPGTVVMPNAVINARTKIGRHCIINTGAVVEHDNTIGEFSHISVGAKLGGTVSVGRKTWIGIGAIVKNNTTVCQNSFIGAGAVVVKDIVSPGVYVGCPAKEMNSCK